MPAKALTEEEKDSKFNDIIELIEQGMPTRKAIKAVKMSTRTFFDIIDESETKEKRYARACEYRADIKFESIEEDYSETPKIDPETGRIDPAWVNLQRLKIDAKKWELAKMMPKKYGDKQETTHIFERPIFNGINLDVQEDDGEQT